MEWPEIMLWVSIAVTVPVVAAAMGHAIWKSTGPPPTIPQPRPYKQE